MLKENQYTELGEDVVKFFKGVESTFSIPLELKYIFQNNNKQKKMVTIKKIPDNFAVILKSHFIVTVNESLFDAFEDEEAKLILFEQEIDKIEYNGEKGTYKLTQPALKTSLGIVNKFTYAKVERAYEIEKETFEQLEKNEN